MRFGVGFTNIDRYAEVIPLQLPEARVADQIEKCGEVRCPALIGRL